MRMYIETRLKKKERQLYPEKASQTFPKKKLTFGVEFIKTKINSPTTTNKKNQFKNKTENILEILQHI